jgi:hypothetical protein
MYLYTAAHTYRNQVKLLTPLLAHQHFPRFNSFSLLDWRLDSTATDTHTHTSSDGRYSRLFSFSFSILLSKSTDAKWCTIHWTLLTWPLVSSAGAQPTTRVWAATHNVCKCRAACLKKWNYWGEQTDEWKDRNKKEKKIENQKKREECQWWREGIPNEIRFRLFNVNCSTLWCSTLGFPLSYTKESWTGSKFFFFFSSSFHEGAYAVFSRCLGWTLLLLLLPLRICAPVPSIDGTWPESAKRAPASVAIQHRRGIAGRFRRVRS